MFRGQIGIRASCVCRAFLAKVLKVRVRHRLSPRYGLPHRRFRIVAKPRMLFGVGIDATTAGRFNHERPSFSLLSR